MPPISSPFRFSADRQTTWLRGLTLFTLLAGALLRIVIWQQNRSLFIDECNLIRNFVEKSYAGLFQPLAYEQFAPPFFSVGVKGLLMTFGVKESVARFIPLLASLASLGLFYGLTTRWLTPLSAWLVSLFFAFGFPFLHYATETKQYATDVFTALLLIHLALKCETLDWKRIVALGLAGMVGVWMSMPAVFVLAAIGFYLLSLAYAAKNRKAGLLTLLTGALWLLNFGAYYFLVLRHDIKVDYLQQSHVFLPFPPMSGNDWHEWGERIFGIRTAAVGFTFVANLAFFSGLAAALPAFRQRKNQDWMLLALPIAFCLAASALHLYSLVERLMLFFIPLVLLLLGLGWQYIGKRWGKIAGGIMSIVVLAAAAGHLQIRYFFTPLEISDIRGGLSHVADHQQPGDVTYGYYDATAVIHHYREVAARRMEVPNYRAGSFEPATELRQMEEGQPAARIWIICGSQEAHPFEAWLQSKRTLLERVDFAGGSVWLFSARR